MSSYDDILGKKPLQKGLANDQQEVPPTPPATPAAQQSTAASQATGGDEQPKRRYMTYGDIEDELRRQDNIMRQNAPETAEERAAREKREKRNKMFAALGDGISALSNLFFTTKGAPNMYNPQTSMSEATRKRMEMAHAARDKEREAYNAAATRRYAVLQDADSKAYRWDTLARQQRLDADEKARKDALADAQAGKYKASQDKDEAMVAFYNAKIKALSEGQTTDNALKMAKIAKLEAERDRANRQGTAAWVSSSSSKGSGGSKKPYSTFLGKEYYNKADLEKAAISYAQERHIPLTYNKKSESVSSRGRSKGTTYTQVNRTIAAVAADAERDYKRRNAQKPQTAAKPQQKPQQKPQGGGNKAAAKRKTTNNYTHTRALGL